MLLRINDYSYPVTHLVALNNFEEGSRENIVYEYEYAFSFKLESSKFQTSLGISSKDDEEKNVPYSLCFQVIGEFEVELEDEKLFEGSKATIERRISIVLKNAVMILYAAAREYIHTVSAKAPYGYETIPSAFFDEKHLFELASKSSIESDTIDLVQVFIDNGLAVLTE